jgi:ubiquinone/menaquinone biosynthesis C-methylase UbiE
VSINPNSIKKIKTNEASNDVLLKYLEIKDKKIEKQRYNSFSADLINRLYYNEMMLQVLGADNFKLYLQAPYLYYHKLIAENTQHDKLQLDLCCGNGMHSFTGAKNGASVIALDYAENSIAICKKREAVLNLNVDFRIADVQILSFQNEVFDIVTCVGSLSYLDNNFFFKEVNRVLKKDGMFICLDSFNHNPIYKLNRLIHYFRGNRSYSTLTRMPDMKTIQLLKEIFSNVEVTYFGIFTFLAPILNLIISQKKIFLILKKLDSKFHKINRYAFKVVIKANK